MGTNSFTFANVLFSHTQQKLLALFYLHPEKSYYTNEIIRLCRMGTGATHRELLKLTESGIIRVEIQGNQKRYSANTGLPCYSELRGLISKTFGLAEVIKVCLVPFASQLELAFIYGSVAKNTDTFTSDIDLMLISNTLGYIDIFPQIQQAENQLGRPINPTFYSTEEWSKKIKFGNNFIVEVKKSPKIFLIGTENELTKLG